MPPSTTFRPGTRSRASRTVRAPVFSQSFGVSTVTPAGTRSSPVAFRVAVITIF